MSTAQLIAVDLLVTLLAAATWLGAGVAAAVRRARVALALLVAAVAVTLIRVGTAAALAADGWWFAQEKITFTLPLLGAAGLVAVTVAGPRLLRPGSAGPSPAAVVALLTAGYAAAAGLLYPLLIGYPATWRDALGTLTVVGAAGVVTWRVVVGTPPVWTVAAVAAVGLAGLGTGLAPIVPGSPAAEAAADLDTGGGPAAGHPAGHGTAVSDLRGPTTPGPGGQVRRFTLTARQTTITLSSGRSVQAWAYNGQVPGPPITATKGDLIEVTLRNADIERGVTLHWHGYDVPPAEDGAPGLTQDAVRPGGEFVYRFRADQVGHVLVPHPSSLGPRRADGSLRDAGGDRGAGHRPGSHRPGAHLQRPARARPHDQPDTRRVAPGTPVRLRLVNTDSTPHRFALAGTAFRVVAVDGPTSTRPVS